MLNIVNFSNMNQGFIIEMLKGNARSVWFLNQKDAEGYSEDLFQNINARDLEEIGGEFCYRIVNGELIEA